MPTGPKLLAKIFVTAVLLTNSCLFCVASASVAMAAEHPPHFDSIRHDISAPVRDVPCVSDLSVQDDKIPSGNPNQNIPTSCPVENQADGLIPAGPSNNELRILNDDHSDNPPFIPHRFTPMSPLGRVASVQKRTGHSTSTLTGTTVKNE